MLSLNELNQAEYQVASSSTCSTDEALQVIIGGKDAKKKSASITNTFGVLSNIRNATVEELIKAGVSKSAALRVKAAFVLSQIKIKEDLIEVTAPTTIAQMLMPEMKHLQQEHFKVVLLNRRSQVISVHTIYIGCANNIPIRVAEIVAPAVKRNAPAMIIVHNHPSGDPSPSPDDVRVTRDVATATKLFDIELLDHIIIGNEKWSSLKEKGLMA